MRIVDIREAAIPLKSNLANSSFDFSEMTTSVVAVITDVIRDGKPVCGFAFNSTGRYACGARYALRRVRGSKLYLICGIFASLITLPHLSTSFLM